MKKIKRKHIGFVIGAFLLVTGWLTRLIGMLFLSDNAVMRLSIDKTGTFISGSGGLFVLGGIVLFAMMSAKEDKDMPQEPLTKEEQQEKQIQELKNAAVQIKNSIPFTAVYGFMSILLVLLGIGVIFNNNNLLIGIGLLFVGLFLSQYYIRKAMRQFKLRSLYKKGGLETPSVTEEYYIDTSKYASIVLRVFSNGTVVALFDDYPLNDTETEKFVAEFSQFIGAKVFRDDRESFMIQSNEEHVIKKAIAFLQIKSKDWEASRIQD